MFLCENSSFIDELLDFRSEAVRMFLKLLRKLSSYFIFIAKYIVNFSGGSLRFGYYTHYLQLEFISTFEHKST